VSKKISIVFTTIRLGGMDVLFNSLATQTFRDFDVVIVDEWHDVRAEPLRDKLRGESLDVLHIPPIRNETFSNSAHGFNSGLCRASGELIIFLADNVWLYPDFLRDHWDVYARAKKYSMCGYFDRYHWPELKAGGDLFWTIFEKEMTCARADEVFRESPYYVENKGGAKGPMIPDSPYNSISGRFYYAAGNESIPLAVIRELNGFDERYDNSWGTSDIDIGLRAEMIGWQFALVETYTKKIGGHTVKPAALTAKPKTWERTPEATLQMFYDRLRRIQQQGEPIPVPKGFGAWN
jgi:glycosyltransferase involved in cell wall biosynthesis